MDAEWPGFAQRSPVHSTTARSHWDMPDASCFVGQSLRGIFKLITTADQQIKAADVVGLDQLALWYRDNVKTRRSHHE